MDEETVEPGTGPEPEPDPVAARLAELTVVVARAHDRAAAREQIIEKLHEDNQRLRAGEGQLLLRPLLTDLQRLRHEILRTVAGLPEQFSVRQTAELLHSFAYSLELTLERGSVVVVTPQPGTAFDPATQRAMGTVPATAPEQDGSVAEVITDGYLDLQTGRTTAPSTVRVHRWTPPADLAPPIVPEQPDRSVVTPTPPP